MADQLYLSLWFPNFELSGLPAALTSVMRQFSIISGDKHVTAATAYPISFSEAPVYQRLYVNDARAESTTDSLIEPAVADATEQLHDDTAYEFEMRWKLWTPDTGFGNIRAGGLADEAQLDTLWRPEPATVKIIGFGPAFDSSAFEQNGHVRIDFGLDAPWVLDESEDESDAETVAGSEAEPKTDPSAVSEDEDGFSKHSNGASEPRAASNLLAFPSPASAGAAVPTSDTAQSIQRNVEMLLAFTLLVEKHCGISSRLLWTESGEPLAEKLIARLQRLH